MKHHPIWAGRITPWLRLGPVPGSYRIKSPPRVMRPNRGPASWAPFSSVVHLLHDPAVPLGISPRRI